MSAGVLGRRRLCSLQGLVGAVLQVERRRGLVLLFYAGSYPLDPCPVGGLWVVESSGRNPSSIQWVYQRETAGYRPLVSGAIRLCSDGRAPPDGGIPLRGFESS